MPVVGLTGCPGAGKSVVAEIFGKLGAEVVSGDELGKEVVEKSANMRYALSEEFGKDILDEDGNLRRRELGKIAFSSKSNLEKLNRLVHPQLLLELQRMIEEHRSTLPKGLMIVDAALIFEWGIADWFDKTMTVYADYWLRLKRLKSLGLSDKEAADRTESQIDQDEKIKRADYTIENNGLMKLLNPQIEKLMDRLLR